MTHSEAILNEFHNKGGSMTLGHILQHPWGYEFRARATELRRKGYIITCQKAKKPSDNVYRLLAAPDPSGQVVLI